MLYVTVYLSSDKLTSSFVSLSLTRLSRHVRLMWELGISYKWWRSGGEFEAHAMMISASLTLHTHVGINEAREVK